MESTAEARLGGSLPRRGVGEVFGGDSAEGVGDLFAYVGASVLERLRQRYGRCGAVEVQVSESSGGTGSDGCPSVLEALDEDRDEWRCVWSQLAHFQNGAPSGVEAGVLVSHEPREGRYCFPTQFGQEACGFLGGAEQFRIVHLTLDVLDYAFGVWPKKSAGEDGSLCARNSAKVEVYPSDGEFVVQGPHPIRRGWEVNPGLQVWNGVGSDMPYGVRGLCLVRGTRIAKLVYPVGKASGSVNWFARGKRYPQHRRQPAGEQDQDVAAFGHGGPVWHHRAGIETGKRRDGRGQIANGRGLNF